MRRCAHQSTCRRHAYASHGTRHAGRRTTHHGSMVSRFRPAPGSTGTSTDVGPWLGLFLLAARTVFYVLYIVRIGRPSFASHARILRRSWMECAGPRGAARAGSHVRKRSHFFSQPRAVPPDFCRRPSTPPGPGHSHGALPAPWEWPGAASRAVRLQSPGGTPGRTFAATLAA